MLFVDLRQLSIANEEDVACIGAEFASRIHALGGRVHAVVNCRGCGVAPAVADSFQRMLMTMEETCGIAMTGYGTPHLLGHATGGMRVLSGQ